MAINEEPVFFSPVLTWGWHPYTMPSSYLFSVTISPSPPFSLSGTFCCAIISQCPLFYRAILQLLLSEEKKERGSEGESAVWYRTLWWFGKAGGRWMIHSLSALFFSRFFLGAVLMEAWVPFHLALPLKAASPTDLFSFFRARHVAECVTVFLLFCFCIKDGPPVVFVAVVVFRVVQWAVSIPQNHRSWN